MWDSSLTVKKTPCS